MDAKALARQNLMNLTPYQPGKPIEEVERELGIKDVVKLASNENPLGPAPEAVAAMDKAIRETQIYPDGNCYYLKEKLAAHWGVSMDNLAIGNGSNELIKLIAKAYLNPGENIVMADPSFSEYKTAAIISNAEVIALDLTEDFRHDLKAMAAAINDRTKLVFICNPNNPTGTIVTKAELDEFMAKVPDSVIVVMDEAYYEYVENKEYPETLDYVKAGRNVIILRTFSKIYSLAALRVGYAIAKPQLIDFINRVREPFNVNRIAQVAAKASLESDHVAKSVNLNSDGRRYLMEQLTALGLKPVTSETNFIFVDVEVNSRQLFQDMMKKGVIIRSGDIFGKPSFARLSIGTESQNAKMIEVLKDCLGK
ncbi:MAG: histidinol-phosphate transaminase [Bacillota bacterium]|nr:histidinol-phosphate transaminase [Bacillota bacterium]